MENRSTFAEALRAERTRRGHNTRAAGEALNVSNATVSNWERGALPLTPGHWLALMSYLAIGKEEFADLIAETARRDQLARFVIEGL